MKALSRNHSPPRGSFGVLLTVVLLVVLGLSGCITFDWTRDPADSDGDGVPDEYDEFPDNVKESKDSDVDGVGDNEDTDDDNDGVGDEEDAFPYDGNESRDNDLDGVGDNRDPDDDNDGFNDTEDIDPLHDIALSFNFTWVNLTVPLNKQSTAWFQFEIKQDGERLKMFDDNGGSWRVPWQEQFNLTTTFEVNVPDNITEHEFQVRAYHVRFFRSTLLDLGDSNESYEGTISYNLSSGNLTMPVGGVMDGSVDNGTDEPDAQLAVSVETIHFGYLKSYEWRYDGIEYTLSYNFDPTSYAQYNAMDHRVRGYDDYIGFATPEDPVLIEFAGSLHDLISGQNLTGLQEGQYILNFVQSLKYSQDNVTTGIGEYPRYPIETLVDQLGDCEDTALLAISLSEILGIESALVLLYEAFPDAGHAAPAFAVNGSGSFYEVGETQYYYGESTGVGWEIGELPDFDSTKAYVYEA